MLMVDIHSILITGYQYCLGLMLSKSLVTCKMQASGSLDK